MSFAAAPSNIVADPFRADIPTDNISPDAEPEDLVAWGLQRFAGRRIALTTAFGMEGCALIDMVARGGGELEVTYLDTHFFFAETHRLREKLEARYPRLRFVNRGTDYTPEQQAAEYGDRLWERNPDQCCYIRKVLPMKRTMEGKDVWFTALRRSQSPTRANLQTIEWDWKYDLLKFNPLAAWSREDTWAYIQKHEVPYNELHERGYPTVGCTHCTVSVQGNVIGQYSRDGRWSGQDKTECGLHGAGI